MTNNYTTQRLAARSLLSPTVDGEALAFDVSGENVVVGQFINSDGSLRGFVWTQNLLGDPARSFRVLGAAQSGWGYSELRAISGTVAAGASGVSSANPRPYLLMNVLASPMEPQFRGLGSTGPSGIGGDGGLLHDTDGTQSVGFVLEGTTRVPAFWSSNASGASPLWVARNSQGALIQGELRAITRGGPFPDRAVGFRQSAGAETGERPFYVDADSPTSSRRDLPVPTGYGGRALGINESGWIVGYLVAPGTTQRRPAVWMWNPADSSYVLRIYDFAVGFLTDINSSFVAVGRINDNATRWQLNGSSLAGDILNADDLNAVTLPGFTIPGRRASNAEGINNLSGSRLPSIVGYGGTFTSAFLARTSILIGPRTNGVAIGSVSWTSAPDLNATIATGTTWVGHVNLNYDPPGGGALDNPLHENREFNVDIGLVNATLGWGVSNPLLVPGTQNTTNGSAGARRSNNFTMSVPPGQFGVTVTLFPRTEALGFAGQPVSYTIRRQNTRIANVGPNLSPTPGGTVNLSSNFGPNDVFAFPFDDDSIPVRYVVNGLNVGTANTDGAGNSAINFQVPSNWAPGNYTIEAIFDGNGRQNPSSAVGTLVVQRAPAAFQTTAVSGPSNGVWNPANNVRLVGVFGGSQASIAGVPVQISYPPTGQSWTFVTNNDGRPQGIIRLNGAVPLGPVTFSLSYGGNNSTQPVSTNYSYMVSNTVPVAGLQPAALQLDGNLGTSFVQLPSNMTLFGWPGGFTFEAWVRPDTLQSRARIFTTGNGQGQEELSFLLNLDSGALQYWQWIGAAPGGQQVNSNPPLQSNNWQHVAVSMNGVGQMTLYVNGQIRGTAVVATPTLLSRAISQIGRSLWSVDTVCFHGQIADMRIWDHARSQSQLLDGARRSLSGSEQGLVAFWRLADQGTGPLNGATPVLSQRMAAQSGNIPTGVFGTFAGWVGSPVDTLEVGVGESSVTVPLRFFDPDQNQSRTVQIVQGPSHGQLTGTGFERTYTPTPGFIGVDQIVYTVSDGVSTSAPATFRIDVRGLPVTGQLAIPNFVGSLVGQPITVRMLSLQGTELEVGQTTVSTPSGQWTYGTRLSPGTYRISVDTDRTVSRSSVVSISAGTGASAGVFALPLGDVNQDGIIDGNDVNAVLSDFGTEGPGMPEDVNGDEIVDGNDINVVLANFGAENS